MPEPEVIRVLKRHGNAMGSMDPDFIAADYAEDAVVLCNLVDKPAVGRAEIRDMIAEILKMNVINFSEDPDAPEEDKEVAQDIAAGEYALHIFENRGAGMKGIETYCVRNDKIVFESAFSTIL